jgi:hypothetical protein
VRLLNQDPNGLLVQRSGRSHLTVIRTHIFLNHLLSSVAAIIKYKCMSVNRFFLQLLIYASVSSLCATSVFLVYPWLALTAKSTTAERKTTNHRDKEGTRDTQRLAVETHFMRRRIPCLKAIK